MKEITTKNIDANGQSGFTLIEAMIATVIFLIVMAAVFGVLRIGLITRNSLNNRSETVGNARTAVNSVGREAVNAGLGYSRSGSIVPDDFANGLWGIPKDSGTERDLLTGVMAGDEVNESDLSLSGEKNDIVAFVYRDLLFNGGDPVIAVNADEASNSVFLDTGTAGCPACNAFDLYLVESSDGNQAMALTTDIDSGRYLHFKFNDPLEINRKTDGNVEDQSILKKCPVGVTANCFSYTPQATLKRVFLTSYSVNSAGTLVRTVYGNNTGEPANKQIQIQPLAYGVQHFQVKYLMNNGSKVDDPSAGNTNQSNMNNVVQVEINITIQAEGNEQGTTSTELINLTSTFSTRNLRYDIE
jgi:prepilin-type N-terminal cleavage/methylation domain-containing protein